MNPEIPYLIREAHGYLNDCLVGFLDDDVEHSCYYANRCFENIQTILIHLRKLSPLEEELPF